MNSVLLGYHFIFIKKFTGHGSFSHVFESVLEEMGVVSEYLKLLQHKIYINKLSFKLGFKARKNLYSYV